MEITAQIIEIFLLGLIGGAVPGPMLTAVFTEVLNSGFKKSLRVVLRALFAETIVATAILLVIYSLNIPESYFYVISIVGSVYLIWLAIKVWKIDKIDGENKEVFIFKNIFAYFVKWWFLDFLDYSLCSPSICIARTNSRWGNYFFGRYGIRLVSDDHFARFCFFKI